MTSNYFIFKVSGKTFNGKVDLMEYIGISYFKLQNLLAVNESEFTYNGYRVEFQILERNDTPTLKKKDSKEKQEGFKDREIYIQKYVLNNGNKFKNLVIYRHLDVDGRLVKTSFA